MGLAAAAGIGAVASIGGALISSNAVGNAADQQAASAQQGIAEQQREFNINQANYAPWLSAGKSALQSQLDLLGLGGSPATTATNPGTAGAPDYMAYFNANPDLVAAWNNNDHNFQGKFSSPQAFAQWHYGAYGQGEGRQMPTTGGTAATTTTTPGVSAGQAQQSAIDALQQSPLYQSLYRNGRDTLLNNAAATGGLRGGNTEHSLANFGADTLASVIQQQLSNLGGISGNGMSSAGGLGQLNGQSANAISNLYGAQGSAQAGGILGQAGIMNNAFNGIGKSLGSLFGSSSGGGGYMPGFSFNPTMSSGTSQIEALNPGLSSSNWMDW